MHPRRSIGKLRVCCTGNEPVVARVHPNIRAPPQHRSEWLARVCEAPCESQTGPNLGIMDRGGPRRGDARYDRASMQRSDMHTAPRPGPTGAGRLPLLSIKQTMGRRHFRPRLFRGVNEDREAINRMTVICPSITT